ncbi:MAG: hypothetical protein M3081_18970 [Gemmatimonadota bacterium]|nr:hypothetical protein [Gemmatimonadota bacterium]
MPGPTERNEDSDAHRQRGAGDGGFQGGLENALLRLTLTDPATGLPNTLYLDLIRNWETAVAARQGAAVHVVALTLDGGTALTRRQLAWDLAEAVRKSDFLASAGPERFYLLLAVRDAGDLATVRRRIEDVVTAVNAKGPSEFHISVDFPSRDD